MRSNESREERGGSSLQAASVRRVTQHRESLRELTHSQGASWRFCRRLPGCIYCLYAVYTEIYSRYFCLTPFVREYNTRSGQKLREIVIFRRFRGFIELKIYTGYIYVVGFNTFVQNNHWFLYAFGFNRMMQDSKNCRKSRDILCQN